MPETGESVGTPRCFPDESFADRISQFSYPESPVAAQKTQSSPVASEILPSSPGLKRKRSQNLGKSQSTISFRPEGGNETPPRKRSSSSKKCESPSKSKSFHSAAHGITSNLHDTLRPNLALVLIGLNPGITTARLGHPYSHPSNGFWKILHTCGITPVQHRPQDHASLPDLYGIGNTNICARPSRLGSELTKAELLEGAKILDEKLALYRPEAACITGKGVWEAMWTFKTGKKTMPKKGQQDAFCYGWQDEKLWLGRSVDNRTREVTWPGSQTFVAPSTSGLNAGMSPVEKEQAWRPMGEWMEVRRQKTKGEKSND